jgi:hypothetical protein
VNAPKSNSEQILIAQYRELCRWHDNVVGSKKTLIHRFHCWKGKNGKRTEYQQCL